MTTAAWKGFIHSWHTLGKVLKGMCVVVVGIPFAVATCILIAAAVLLFVFLCLAAVYYPLKGLYFGIKTTVEFIKDPKARLQTLPTSSSRKDVGKKQSMLVPLQSWGASTKANQVSDPSEPPGYIYPWYEGSPEEPAQAHLGSDTDRQPPRPASSIRSGIEADAVPNPDALPNHLAEDENASAEGLAENFNPILYGLPQTETT